MTSKKKPEFSPMPEQLGEFRVFLTMVWRCLGLPDPTPIQLDIARYLQYGPRRKVVQAFRGVGKSWITAAYVVWRLRSAPNLKFMIVSATKDRADNFTTFTLKLVGGIPLLRCLAPGPGQRCSKTSFDVGPAQADQAPSVTSKGIFSQITGGRADEIIADDIEIPGNSFTSAMRGKLGEAVKEFDAVLKPGGRITYLGTPQTEQSLYNALLQRGYDARVWPARYPDPERAAAFGGERLAPMIRRALAAYPELAGSPCEPSRFSESDLRERELSYGRAGFQLQFMLDTRLSDAARYPLKLSDLIVMPCNADTAPEKPVWGSSLALRLEDLPAMGLDGDAFYGPARVEGEFLPYAGAVMAVDPSGRGSDETACVVVKILNGFLYVTALRAFRDGYAENTLREMALLAQQEKVRKVIIESNFGDGMFTKLAAPYFAQIYPVALEEVRNKTQKEARIIDTLEPVLNQHKLVVAPKVVLADIANNTHGAGGSDPSYRLFYQLTRITRERGALSHDDRLDCLAMAVGYWTSCMGQNPDRRMAQRREELLREELRAWRGEARGALSIADCAGNKALFTFKTGMVNPGKQSISCPSDENFQGNMNYIRKRI